MEEKQPVISDDQFIQMVNIIAQKHKCNIVEVDLENKILILDGPDDAQVACAIELEDLLGRYSE